MVSLEPGTRPRSRSLSSTLLLDRRRAPGKRVTMQLSGSVRRVFIRPSLMRPRPLVGSDRPSGALPVPGPDGALALGKDRPLAAFELGLGGDIADGAMQTHGVVVFDVGGHQASCIAQRDRRIRPNTLPLQGPMPALKLAVALGIERRGPHVGHRAQPAKFFEILGNQLGAVVRDDARGSARN